MVNYSNGKVCKIEPTVEMLDEGDIYIGSTTKEYLSQRIVEHRGTYTQFKKGNPNFSKISSYDLFDKYGLDKCKITLVEVSSCNSRDELTAQESFYVRSLKCVNKNIPSRTHKEYRVDKKEDIKKYAKKRNQIKIECECGSVFGIEKKTRHLKTIKHLKFVEERKSVEPILLKIVEPQI